MKNNILLILLLFLIPIIIGAQTQVATTSDGRKVILNPDGTWKNAEQSYIEEEQKRINDITNQTKNSIFYLKNSGISDLGISYDLAGRNFQALPPPKYDYQGEGKVVVEINVDRNGNVTQAKPGVKGSTTLDEAFLNAAWDAALKAKFESKSDAPSVQKGTITYNFMLK